MILNAAFFALESSTEDGWNHEEGGVSYEVAVPKQDACLKLCAKRDSSKTISHTQNGPCRSTACPRTCGWR